MMSESPAYGIKAAALTEIIIFKHDVKNLFVFITYVLAVTILKDI